MALAIHVNADGDLVIPRSDLPALAGALTVASSGLEKQIEEPLYGSIKGLLRTMKEVADAGIAVIESRP